MNSNEKPNINTNGILFASALGVLLGGLTLTIESLSSIVDSRLIGAAQKALIILLLPGMIGAMGLSGNVHVWHLWVAAAINGVIYFGIGWFSYALGARYRRRSRLLAAVGPGNRQDSESRSDSIH
jgi:hypothetical protein